MLGSEARLHMKVIFGRGHGEQSLGIITKVNPAKAAVKLLSTWRLGRGSEVGSQWRVPYSMMRPATEAEIKGADSVAVSVPKTNDPIQFNQFDEEDNFILGGICSIYNSLEPENLACDGETSTAFVLKRSSELNHKLKMLCSALGRNVTAEQIDKWDADRRSFLGIGG